MFQSTKELNITTSYALKRSVYNLKTVNDCISLLKILFNYYDDILLDFEGKEWEYSLGDLEKLVKFLKGLDKSKRLVYTVAVRSSLWNYGDNFGNFIYLVKTAKEIDQLTFCLVTGHKTFLSDSESKLKSKISFDKFISVIIEEKLKSEWFLGSDKIENLAGTIAQDNKSCTLMLLQSKDLSKVIEKFNKKFNLKLNQIAIYGLWIDDYIDDYTYDYLERRNIIDITIENSIVQEYTVNNNSVNKNLYDKIKQIFLLYKVSFDDFEINQLIIECSKNIKIESS